MSFKKMVGFITGRQVRVNQLNKQGISDSRRSELKHLINLIDKDITHLSLEEPGLKTEAVEYIANVRRERNGY